MAGKGKMLGSGLVFDHFPLLVTMRIRGHSCREIAEQAGLTESVVRRVVTGQTHGGLGATKVAGVLGVDLAACWRRTDGRPIEGVPELRTDGSGGRAT